MSKKETVIPFTQQDLDLMFYQYCQGVKDSSNLPSHNITVDDLQTLVDAKFKHIKSLHIKPPSFTMTVVCEEKVTGREYHMVKNKL